MCILIILLGLLVSIFQGCFPQKLDFPSALTYHENLEGKGGNWSIDGTIELSQEDLTMFEPRLEVQIVSTMCTLDLSTCTSDVDVQKYADTCYCEIRNNDIVNVHIGSKARSSQNGYALQAMIPAKPAFKPLSSTLFIARIPTVTNTSTLKSRTTTVPKTTSSKQGGSTINKTTKSLVSMTTLSTPIGVTTALIDVCDKVKFDVSSENHKLVVPSDSEGVLCDVKTDGGRWTIIQRRVSGQQDFYKNWQSYVNGFGVLYGEFWFGLKKINELCGEDNVCEVRFDLKFNNTKYYANYSHFKVDGPEQNYRLTVSGYSGNAGDDGYGFSYHNGMDFSTKDNNSDSETFDCAHKFKGGWWYRKCHYVNINGIWGNTDSKGLNWYALTAHDGSVIFSEMKVRRRHC